MWPLDTLIFIVLFDLIILAVTGGFALELPFVTMSSNHAARPLVALVVLLLIRFIIEGVRHKPVVPFALRGFLRGLPVILVLIAAASVSALFSGFQYSSGAFLAAGAFLSVLAICMALATYASGRSRYVVVGASVNTALVCLLMMFSPSNDHIWEPHGSFALLFPKAGPPSAVRPYGVFAQTDLPARNVSLGGDTRPALIFTDGVGFLLPAGAPGKQFFAFSVGKAPGIAKEFQARLTVSVRGGNSDRTTILEEEFVATDVILWRDFKLEVDVPDGPAAVELFLTGSSGTTVAIANPRFVDSESSRPNIILMVVDALRADHMSLHGYERGTSQELDKWAEGALVFNRTRAVSSWTLPSMASIFTGLHPSSHGLTSTYRFLPPALKTFPEHLVDQGYFTLAIQTNTLLTESRGFARGFSRYNELPVKMPDTLDREIYPRADRVNGYALDLLRALDDSPYFLYLHYMDVHKPYEPPLSYDVYGDEPVDKYDGTILATTTEIARFMDVLEKEGRLENTVVIFTGDHGEQFYEHGDSGHGKSLHFEELNIPLVIWAPKVHPSVVEDFAQNHELFTAILDTAGVKRPQHASPLPAWPESAPKAAPRRYCFSELELRESYKTTLRSIETGAHKLITDSARDSAVLYDIAADINETVIVTQPDEPSLDGLQSELDMHVEVLKELREKLGVGDTDLDLSASEVERIRGLGYFN